MRTNVIIDDALMEKALQLTGARTKKDVIHQALALLVEIKTKQALLNLPGKVTWEGDLESLRTDRVSSRAD